MSVILVASDRPGAGKTAAALALKSIVNQAGKTAVAFKPFASGADDVDGRTFDRSGKPRAGGLALAERGAGPVR